MQEAFPKCVNHTEGRHGRPNNHRNGPRIRARTDSGPRATETWWASRRFRYNIGLLVAGFFSNTPGQTSFGRIGPLLKVCFIGPSQVWHLIESRPAPLPLFH